ncbi:MAG: hypothetical protein ACYSOC_05670 [Planctomycetota bacterium]|jgi:hypothetical protein
MWLNRLTVLGRVALCVITLSGCKGDNESSIVNSQHQASIEICNVLNSIDSEESAKEAIPKLKELAEKYTQAKNEFLDYQKNNPGFEQEYLQESLRVMKDWGEALASFNTNQNISTETREQIMKILSL